MAEEERRESSAHLRRSRRSLPARTEEAPARVPEMGFITREDLSQFLSIKPFLSEKAQTIIEIVEEIHKNGGKLDPMRLTRLIGMFAGSGSSNLNMLASLANLAGAAGKIDPDSVTSLLGALTKGGGAPKDESTSDG